jgi:hypothetical protein
MNERIKEILDVLGALAWRGFGLFLFILGGAAGTGAIVAGSWLQGIAVAWGTLMLGVIAAIGYAIAVTGKVDKDIVAKATQDAVQKIQDEDK